MAYIKSDDPRIGEQPPLPDNSISINGSFYDTVERMKVRELIEGWGCHRDAAEWGKYRALFTEDGAVATTWSKVQPVDNFIKISKEGMKKGAFIMHRIGATTVDLAVAGPATGQRAVAKMKATITQRFALPGGDVDIECDCRFVAFTKRDKVGDWKIFWVKLFYEKDKVIPVNPCRVPQIDEKELEGLPEGYKYLAWAQAKLGYDMLLSLPDRFGDAHDQLYRDIQTWLNGGEVGQAHED